MLRDGSRLHCQAAQLLGELALFKVPSSSQSLNSRLESFQSKIIKADCLHKAGVIGETESKWVHSRARPFLTDPLLKDAA